VKNVIIKFFWERCREFIVEDEDAFLVEATAEEASSIVIPLLSPRERVKFDQMKDIYVAKETSGRATAGSYYFLVSRAKELKFESVAILTSDLSGRGGNVKAIPDIKIASIDELDKIDPSAY